MKLCYQYNVLLISWFEKLNNLTTDLVVSCSREQDFHLKFENRNKKVTEAESSLWHKISASTFLDVTKYIWVFGRNKNQRTEMLIFQTLCQ